MLEIGKLKGFLERVKLPPRHSHNIMISHTAEWTFQVCMAPPRQQVDHDCSALNK